MLKYFFSIFVLVVVLLVTVAGFRGQKFQKPPIELFPDMDHQPKVKSQVPSSFYADGRGNRAPINGTVPLGYAMPQHKLIDGSAGESQSPYKQVHFSGGVGYSDTGKMGTNWGTGIPLEVTPELIARGQERFNISCAVCHGATGAGNGIAGKYGLVAIANMHQDRIRQMADGEIFNTITHGKNTMMGYGDRIQVQDRWAIITYIRALQKSQGGATINDVPANERAKLESQNP
jgi:mono/diheme cytochrome c family protein